MENNFNKTHKLIHEYNELTQILNNLQDENINLGSIIDGWDNPGINYTTYSKNAKNLFIDAINHRLKEIEKNFN